MKKVMIKCVLTTFLTVGLLSIAIANPNLPAVEIVQASYEKKISFEARGVQGKSKVSLQDSEGVSLYVNTWKNKTKVGKIFDLEQLPAGKYTLIFETEENEILQPFSIETHKIQLASSDRIIRHIPIVTKKEEFIDVSWTNDQTSSLVIQIENENGELMMEDKLKGVLKVARRYNVSRLTSGIYFVKVKTQKKTYYKEISW